MVKNSILITRLQFFANCGVTEQERDTKQPFWADIRFQCHNQAAFHSDQLADTVDYGAIASRVRDIGQGTSFSLIETMAEQMCQALFQEFPLVSLYLWIRKRRPPLQDIVGSVGIQVTRTRPVVPLRLHDRIHWMAPSPYLIRQFARLPRGHALDVAAGNGRNSVFLASRGYSVHAIDQNAEALSSLDIQAYEAGYSSLSTQIIDLEPPSAPPPTLGHHTYDLILVFFYLYRPLFPALLEALRPGGMLIYETFLIDNHQLYHHPRRKEFCLERNELLKELHPMRILHYEEGPNHDQSGTAITARCLAQKLP